MGAEMKLCKSAGQPGCKMMACVISHGGKPWGVCRTFGAAPALACGGGCVGIRRLRGSALALQCLLGQVGQVGGKGTLPAPPLCSHSAGQCIAGLTLGLAFTLLVLCSGDILASVSGMSCVYPGQGHTSALGTGAPGLPPVLLASTHSLRDLLLPLQQLCQPAHLHAIKATDPTGLHHSMCSTQPS